MQTIKFLTRETPGGAVPDILLPELNKKSYPENRTGDVISFIEKHEIIALGYDSSRFRKNEIYCIKNETINRNGVISIKTYKGWSKSENNFVTICVTEYDKAQSMLITNYEDHTDEITPLISINDELNLWEDIL